MREIERLKEILKKWREEEWQAFQSVKANSNDELTFELGCSLSAIATYEQVIHQIEYFEHCVDMAKNA